MANRDGLKILERVDFSDDENDDNFKYEVLEINASVVIHRFSTQSPKNYLRAVEVFTLALQNVFNE